MKSAKTNRHVAAKSERGRGHLSLNPSPPLRGGEGSDVGPCVVHLAEAKVLMRSDWKFNPRIARINANNEISMGPRPRGRGKGWLIPHLSLLDVTAFP